jgi:hypothetical protein
MSLVAKGGRIRLLPLLLIVAAVLFGLAQLLPFGRVKNKPTIQEPPWDSPRTRQLAVAACYDCHSDQTKNQWYLHVAPISWWTANHVAEGRAALNFSEYDGANHRSGARVAGTVEDGGMPPSYYTWLGRHPAAKLSPADRQALVKGLEATYGTGAGSGAGHDGDKRRG